MYTLKRGTALTATIVNAIIDYNESLAGRYEKLDNYYMGNHTGINERTKEREELSNNKIVVNTAKYITDINVGFLLGNPVEYQASNNHDIEAVTDEYKKQTINDLDTELATSCSIMGHTLEYIYANEDAEPRSTEVDKRSGIMVYDTTVEHKELYGVIYRPIYQGEKLLYHEVVVADDKEVVTYNCYSKRLNEVSRKPHNFKDVPMVEYRNNSRYIGDFEPVISLIDAYNMLQSDRLNDKEQLVDAILAFYGVEFDEKQKGELKQGRMVSGIPKDAKIEYIYKTLQEADVDVLRKTLEQDIHKVSMTPNMSDDNFVGNSSGVAIEYKLLAFEQHIKNKERYMEKGLMRRFKLYNNFLVTKSKMKEVPIHEVDAIFKRNLPKNDLETSQMINNLDGKVDDATLISRLSFIKDADDIIEQLKKQEEAQPPKRDYDDLFKNNEIVDANTVVDPEVKEKEVPTDE